MLDSPKADFKIHQQFVSGWCSIPEHALREGQAPLQTLPMSILKFSKSPPPNWEF